MANRIADVTHDLPWGKEIVKYVEIKGRGVIVSTTVAMTQVDQKIELAHSSVYVPGVELSAEETEGGLVISLVDITEDPRVPAVPKDYEQPEVPASADAGNAPAEPVAL